MVKKSFPISLILLVGVLPLGSGQIFTTTRCRNQRIRNALADFGCTERQPFCMRWTKKGDVRPRYQEQGNICVDSLRQDDETVEVSEQPSQAPSITTNCSPLLAREGNFALLPARTDLAFCCVNDQADTSQVDNGCSAEFPRCLIYGNGGEDTEPLENRFGNICREAPGEPSTTPSKVPSRQPVAVPSSVPSKSPSRTPTGMPSKSPTGMPSIMPSKQPTSTPSKAPSPTPSKQPSQSPTGSPVDFPVAMPSQVPSKAPTGQPSSQPSTQPSKSPSVAASGNPTATASGNPTVTASGNPTATASENPTVTASGVPSNGPTGAPIPSPSAVPSGSPIMTPSGMPSGSPSDTASGVPTGSPTAMPSPTPSQSSSASPTLPFQCPCYVLFCGATHVCEYNEWSFTCTGEHTADDTFNSIAVMATGDESASYDFYSSKSFADLLVCTASSLRDDLLDQIHHWWEGFADYNRQYSNEIIIDKDGGLVSVLDTWGERCEHNSPDLETCEIDGGFLFECQDGNCNPQTLSVSNRGGDATIDIYEPCNFVSSLSYYRVMPQLCGSNFYTSEDYRFALNHGFALMAGGAAFRHGSHTFLGHTAELKSIDVVAFLIHQQIMEAVAGAASLDTGMEGFAMLYNIGPEPRARTAVEVALDVTEFIKCQPSWEWPMEFQSLDIPPHGNSFVLIACTVVAVLFPDKPDFVTHVLNKLVDVLQDHVHGHDSLVNDYIPALISICSNISLHHNQRFVLFRQFLGAGAKLMFGLLWQEGRFQIDFLNDPLVNEHAAFFMPIVNSFFNFLSGFEHVDNDFQRFTGMYPGDQQCRETQPHSKWHEISASALLDMVYLGDCVGAILSGSDHCAHIYSIEGKDKITIQSMKEWIKSEVVLLGIPFPGSIGHDVIMNLVSDLLTNKIFPLLDKITDGTSLGQIDWDDINSADDLVNLATEFFNQLLGMYEGICKRDSDCSNGQFCDHLGINGTPLKCSDPRSNGLSCTSPTSCQSGTCAFESIPDDWDNLLTECGQGCNSNGDCSGDEWCDTTYSPKICKPKKSDGAFPCVANDQCTAGKCAWYGGCRRSGDNSCNHDFECDHDEFCENVHHNWCLPKMPRHFVGCRHENWCQSGWCGDRIFGIGRCKGENGLQWCQDLGCTVQSLQDAINWGLDVLDNFDLPWN